MLYPFLADANEGQLFIDAAAQLTTALQDIQPFTICFTKDSFKCFKHKRFCTLWLKPFVDAEDAKVNASSDVLEDLGTPHPDVVKLQDILVEQFPQCSDVNKISERGFTPHLSVGQFKFKVLKNFVRDFQENWHDTCIEFKVDHVCLISRADFHDPFHVRHRVPLRGGDV